MHSVTSPFERPLDEGLVALGIGNGVRKPVESNGLSWVLKSGPIMSGLGLKLRQAPFAAVEYVTFLPQRSALGHSVVVPLCSFCPDWDSGAKPLRSTGVAD